MAKRVQHEKPARTAEAAAWISSETEDQKRRHAAIVKEMEALQPERDKWIEEFLQLIQTRGFYVTGDVKRPIPADEVPSRPDRADADQVVW